MKPQTFICIIPETEIEVQVLGQMRANYYIGPSGVIMVERRKQPWNKRGELRSFNELLDLFVFLLQRGAVSVPVPRAVVMRIRNYLKGEM